MIRYSAVCISILFLLDFSVKSTAAQSFRINAGVGLKQNVLHPIESNQVLVPFWEIEKKLIKLDTTGLVLSGAFYWDDGIKEADAIYCPGCITFRHRTNMLGLRLILHGTKQHIPVQFSVGATRHLINNIYITGTDDFSGNPGKDHRNGYWTIDPGVRLRVPIFKMLAIIGDVQYHLPLVEENSIFQPEIQYKMGVSYQISQN